MSTVWEMRNTGLEVGHGALENMGRKLGVVESTAMEIPILRCSVSVIIYKLSAPVAYLVWRLPPRLYNLALHLSSPDICCSESVLPQSSDRRCCVDSHRFIIAVHFTLREIVTYISLYCGMP